MAKTFKSGKKVSGAGITEKVKPVKQPKPAKKINNKTFAEKTSGHPENPFR